jgi:hypothetical protein
MRDTWLSCTPILAADFDGGSDSCKGSTAAESEDRNRLLLLSAVTGVSPCTALHGVVRLVRLRAAKAGDSAEDVCEKPSYMFIHLMPNKLFQISNLLNSVRIILLAGAFPSLHNYNACFN